MLCRTALDQVHPDHEHSVDAASQPGPEGSGSATTHGDATHGDATQGSGDGGDGVHHAVGEAQASPQGSPLLRLRRHRAVAAHEDDGGVAVTN